MRYTIRVSGASSPLVRAAFDEFEVEPLEDQCLEMVGTLVDEAALHGVLHRLQNLGLAIIEVRRLGP